MAAYAGRPRVHVRGSIASRVGHGLGLSLALEETGRCAIRHSRHEEALVTLGDWLFEGSLEVRERVDTCIEIVPAAFVELFDGSNEGKLIVKMASEPLARLNV